MDRVARLWNAAALQVFHFCILFVLVNVVVGFSYTWYDRHHPVVANGAGPQVVHIPKGGLMAIDNTPYEGQDYDTVKAMVHDMMGLDMLGFPYQAYVGFTLPVYHSHYVNVDDDGGFHYRRNTEPPASGEHNVDIYMLGGSTTFGLNLRDQDTLASCLERILNQRAPTELPGRHIRVFNWGIMGYYSSQEVALLDGLVRAGRKPAMVISMDGVNDCLVLLTRPDVPNFTDVLQTLSDKAQLPHNHLADFSFIPIIRLAVDIRSRLHPPPPPPPPYLGSPDKVRFIMHHNRAVARAICAECGAIYHPYLQPVSFYRYNMDVVNVIPTFVWDHRDTYAATYAAVEKDPDITTLTALPAAFGAARQPFLDFCHYTPQFDEYIAQALAKDIDLKSLDTPPSTPYNR